VLNAEMDHHLGGEEQPGNRRNDRACGAELAAAIDAELDAGRRPDLDGFARRFAPDPAAIPDITVELVPLHLYDELGTVWAGSAA